MNHGRHVTENVGEREGRGTEMTVERRDRDRAVVGEGLERIRGS